MKRFLKCIDCYGNQFECLKSMWFRIGNCWISKWIISIFRLFHWFIKWDCNAGNDTPHYSDNEIYIFIMLKIFEKWFWLDYFQLQVVHQTMPHHNSKPYHKTSTITNTKSRGSYSTSTSLTWSYSTYTIINNNNDSKRNLRK